MTARGSFRRSMQGTWLGFRNLIYAHILSVQARTDKSKRVRRISHGSKGDHSLAHSLGFRHLASETRIIPGLPIGIQTG